MVQSTAQAYTVSYRGILGSHTALRNHSGPAVAEVVKLTVKRKPYFGRRGLYLTKKNPVSVFFTGHV